MHPKPIVYVVIDGMNVEALERAIGSGRAPALRFLKERAHYRRDAVAVFPTITPAATASLITGATPAEHGIPGMSWYDRSEQRYVNYGQSPRAAVVQGASQIVEDAVYNLNCRHLSPQVRTLHEDLDELGLITASINYMVFRGPHLRELKPNFLEHLLFRKQLPDALPGPREHYYADVLKGPADGCAGRLPRRGIEERIAATDGYAACVTRDLLERGAADMILFYLHENDHLSHSKGPISQVDSLAGADAHIAYVLDAFDSWDEALTRAHFVVTADHSQSPIEDDDDHIHDLREVLGGFSHMTPNRNGKDPFEDRDLACAGNGRVGFIYIREGGRERLLPSVVSTLKEHPGVDQVMWRDADEYVVATGRGTMRFRVADGDGVVDELDNKWMFSGALEAVSGVVEEGRIETPEYPLAMWRIKSALDLDRIGDVVVTPRLGHEFKDLGGGDHKGGGDHASLHAQDSIVPIISTIGRLPGRPTTVDIAPHIRAYFSDAR